jgi:tetratricopeptide (TPR) repeat protein
MELEEAGLRASSLIFPKRTTPTVAVSHFAPHSRRDMMRISVSNKRRAAIAVVVIALVLAGVGRWIQRERGPAPLRLSDLGALDADVAAFIAEQLERVAAEPKSATAWVALAAALEANGVASAAPAVYETALELDSSNPRWWYRSALLQWRLGNPDNAVASLDRALQLDATYAPAHARRGSWMLDRGEVASAEASFRRAAQIDPGLAAGPIGLARVSLTRGEPQQAVDTLERLLNDHPGDRYALQLLGTAYRRLGREDDARFALTVGAGGEPVTRDPWLDEVGQAQRGFASVLKQATRLALAGRFAEAIPLLERLRVQRPDDVALLTHLGAVYAGAGRVSESIALLESVLARSPDSFEAHLNLATAHVFLRQLDQAAIHADRAIALRPGSARAHDARGMILWQSGRPAEAVAAFEKALTLDPRNQRPAVYIGLIQLERGQSATALRYFEQALKSNPMMADALVGIGMAQIELGAIDQAESALGQAAQIDPENARLRTAQDRLRQRARR